MIQIVTTLEIFCETNAVAFKRRSSRDLCGVWDGNPSPGGLRWQRAFTATAGFHRHLKRHRGDFVVTFVSKCSDNVKKLKHPVVLGGKKIDMCETQISTHVNRISQQDTFMSCCS